MIRMYTEKPQENRIYFFDAMRAILIFFIIIIHILQSFNPNASWLIYNNNDIKIAPYIIDFLMLFTLQSFFIMSGYLAAMSIKKRNIQHFFHSRIKRVLIPVIVTSLTFNSFQAYLLNQLGWMNITLYSYLSEGRWVPHLWFLIDLAIFFLLTYLSIRFINPILQKTLSIFNKIFEKGGLYTILFLFSFIILAFIILFSILSPYIYNPIINVRSMFFYFPFFILGTLLFLNKTIFKQFIQVDIIKTLLVTIPFGILSVYFETPNNNNIKKIFYYFFNSSSNIFASALCFALFYKFFNKKSKLFSFLAEASFSIYLFHHLIVIAISLLMIHFNIGGYLGFLILLISVILITLSLHHFVISKIKILAFLYNGKKLKK